MESFLWIHFCSSWAKKESGPSGRQFQAGISNVVFSTMLRPPVCEITPLKPFMRGRGSCPHC